ncbi:MAG: VWA domain-containing protein [Myxococcales bacterium]|nr:VWA domain-containing protein [Myxococcales bacterium]
MLAAGAALALTACLDHPLKPVEYDKSSEGEKTVAIEINKDVDILFVIDNSGSMAEEQERVAANFKAFIDVLEAPDVQANYRIGITTTDVGNPRCSNTTPENGSLVLQSCLDRVANGEFVTADGDFSTACTNNCSLSGADLTVAESGIEQDASMAKRKWIEKINTVSNVRGTDSMVDAFKCFGPQGITGCGFESHLEAMYKALAAASDKNAKNNYGFLRAQAILSIVFITDEVDCSFNPTHKDIFINNKTFWWSPDDPAPTSSLCWDAGVACDGSAPIYDTCYSENYDVNAIAGASDADAVLIPVQKYIDFVQGIETKKQDTAMDQQILVSLIAGVPSMYESFGAEIPYADSMDADYMSKFGIGPGCIVGPANAPEATAVPPVREREFAEAFNVDPKEGRNLYSICDDDYSAALADIADKIRDQIKPACMPSCVRDIMPEDELVQPNCQLYEENQGAGTRVPVVKCTEGVGPMGMPAWIAPAGATVCYATLTDKGGQTPSMLDDMSTECLEQGLNLEFILVRAGAAPAGTTISAACALSENKAKDCPML